MYNNYKEIVTKAVIGKGKKKYTNDYEITLDRNIDNVLGCWVINHDIRGKKFNDQIKINGSYDVNIWYSYDNNSKTDVINKKIYYQELVKVKLKEDSEMGDDSDIIIRCLKNPSCTDVSNNKNTIKYTISKELGIEVVGDAKIKIAIQNNEDDYDIIEDEVDSDSEIDKNVEENYLKNQ